MNKTMLEIGVLQARLNDLMGNIELYTDEIYTLSQRLDELIVTYYKQVATI